METLPNPLTAAKSLKRSLIAKQFLNGFNITAFFISGRRVKLFQRPQSLFPGDRRLFSSRSHLQIIADSERDKLAKLNGFNLAQFPPEKIRNFSIVAHIDHGKSTLADRLLENPARP